MVNPPPLLYCAAVGKLSDSPAAALQQKATRLLLKDAIDRDSLTTGRSYDRFTTILDQLRREDASAGLVMILCCNRAEEKTYVSIIFLYFNF